MACTSCTSGCSSCTTVTYVDPCTTTTACTGCEEYYPVECILNPDGTNGSTGITLPPLTTAEITALGTPSAGTTVYNTTLLTICFYNGTTWQKVTNTAM